MHVTELPDKSQDHLKAIFDLQEWGDGSATLGRIAERLGQRTSTTSEAIKRLAAKGLVEHTPTRDPHGDPIPDARGMVTVPEVFTLADAKLGDHFIIDRISDRDPALLRYLTTRGLLLGATVEVLPRPYPELADLLFVDVSAEHADSAMKGEHVQLPVGSLGAVLCREVGNA
ncbi:metal-dependent transcriptional regulator [Corynebacterium dentalis]|uniref:metal-dependent transcriptional regulator n=1 Tax=Corynebacterium dentalis TaxID=2014528 RepID=UPI00190EE017|nr:FeoA domain-containing protein [Corynebacterium dentalis]